YLPNQGATAPGSATLNNPDGIFFDATNKLLYVNDSVNNRVAILNANFTANDENASYVLGQANFTASGTATTQSGQSAPLGVAYAPAAGTPSIALVDSASASGSSVSSLGATFSTGNTPGNLIIAFVRISATTAPTSVTDLAGNSYTLATSRTQVSDNHSIYIYYAKNISTYSGGSNVVTANFAASNAHPYIAIYEYAGLDPTSPLDKSAANFANGTTAASSGATATTTAANELVFVGVGTPTSFTGTVASTAGFTMLKNNTVDNNAAAEAEIVSSTGAYTGTMTLSTTASWSAAVATFKASATSPQIFVADTGNNRVLAYNATTLSNGMNATAVLGQVNFTSSVPSLTTQSKLYGPTAVAWDPGSSSGASLVQSTSGAGAAVTSLAQTFGSNNTLGNLIIAFVRCSTSTQTVTVADTAGNTYTDAVNTSSTGDHQLHIFYAKNIQAGANTVTASFSASNANPYLAIYEYSGLDTTSPLDKTVSANGTSATASTGTTATTSWANELVFAGLGVASGYAGTLTSTEGYTTLQQNVTIPNAIAQGKVVGLAGTFTASTKLTSSQKWTGAVATFKAVPGSRLFVADRSNSRVLVFNGFPISNSMNAANVLGQTDFVSAISAVTQAGMSNPSSLAFDSTNNRLFVSDDTAQRVTVFNTSSISNGMNAANVIGQTDYVSTFTGLSQSTLNVPEGLAYSASQNLLYVADKTNNRVLAFPTSSITNGENASYVIGEPDFSSSTPATNQTGLSTPYGVAYDAVNNRLYVSDTGADRVLGYDVGSIENGMPASVVLGQVDFTASLVSIPQAYSLSPGWGLAFNSANNQLLATENASRVLVFDTSSTAQNTETGSDLLGQYTSLSSPSTVSWIKDAINNGPGNLGLNSPQTAVIDAINHRLFVADYGNNRVAVYNLNSDNSFSGSAGGHTIANVLGQADFLSDVAVATQSGLHHPTGLAFDSFNNRLFVADQDNNRVVVFNTASITNGMNAAYVLGQPDFTSNNNTATQSTLYSPQDVAFDSVNNRLFVADTVNNRVMVFNVAPGSIANGENASYVLGQTTYTGNGCNVTRSGMSGPNGLAYDAANSRLFEAENSYGCAGNGGNRVLAFNVAPGTIANGENASNVIGQANYTSNGFATSQTGMYAPAILSYDGNTGRLFVADYSNSRTLIFNAGPSVIKNGMNAAYVLGAPNFTSTVVAATQAGLNLSNGVFYDAGSGRVFVSDSGNNRVLIFEGSYLGNYQFGPGYD
ncbi:MAG: NHL repeat-containing protein, partial [Pseudomonadota bacterium]|nr:NHL repeat-containing protein [Pseudomonadota bacterium]